MSDTPLPLNGDLRIYGQVVNLLDRAPPAVPAAYGRTGSSALNVQLYDTIGRRYFLGFQLASSKSSERRRESRRRRARRRRLMQRVDRVST